MTTEESLQAIRDNYLAWLVSMSATPRPDEDIDGKKLDFGKLQEVVMAGMQSQMALVASGQPYVLTTVHRL